MRKEILYEPNYRALYKRQNKFVSLRISSKNNNITVLIVHQHMEKNLRLGLITERMKVNECIYRLFIVSEKT